VREKAEAMREILYAAKFFLLPETLSGRKLLSLISSCDFPNTDDAIKISFLLASVAAFHPYYGQ